MKFFRKKLKSGVTVLHEKRDIPVVALSITNRFGAMHETSDIKGIAHLIEHLVFTGTKTRTHEDISREVEKRGGVINAFTVENATSFLFKLPSEHIFAGLDILADILNNPIFEEKKFEKEKKVILEEIKMYHDMPQSEIYDKILSCLYEKPFGEGVIGSEKTIRPLQRNMVSKFFVDHYNPANYIVSIVGKADFNRICNYLEKKFTPNNAAFTMSKIKKKNDHLVEERAGIDQSHFIWAMHAPFAKDKKRYAFEVLDAYLANGMSSKLFLTIREERGLAYSVRSSFDCKKEYGHYTIYVGTTKEAIPQVKQLILEGFKAATKMTSKEFDEAKERLIGLQKISTEESMNVMNELAFTELATCAEEYYEYEKHIKAVKKEDVFSLAKIKDFSTAAIVPK
ncbi:MAG: pitrilysin family protein [Nanoarchaeota archaeon]